MTLQAAMDTAQVGQGPTPGVCRAPFPFFGGKSLVAPEVWAAFGDVVNYVEPFAGSLAVLLNRPAGWTGQETVNDRDGFICNFWRALAADPAAVARWAYWPVNENDLHARHAWLLARRGTLTAQLEGDPDYCDAKIAGWWVWGISAWIGSGWCAGIGPWTVNADRELVRRDPDAVGGTGVKRQRPHLTDAGMGVHRKHDGLDDWFVALAVRLRRVRVCCGDWARICGPTPTVAHGLTGVFLDPPYDEDLRDAALYATDTVGIAKEVGAWAREWGDHPLMRIVLCGYDGEHTMPASWRAVPWQAQGGYGVQGDGAGRANASREILWLSPHCVGSTRGSTHQQGLPLFAGEVSA